VLDMAINQAVPVAVSFATANVAAAVVSVQAHDGGRFVAIIGGITVAITSVCGMISFLAPRVAQVIKDAVPPIVEALDTVRKQREELAKGSYAEQIEGMKEMLADLKGDNERAHAQLVELKEDNARAKANLEELERLHGERAAVAAERLEAANRKLHEIRNQMGNDILRRDVKIQELEQEVHGLREEVKRLVDQHAVRADAQDQQLAANAATIASSVGSIATILRGRTPDPDFEPSPDGSGVNLGIDVTGAPVPGKGEHS
jgi:hypothetical protein